MSRFVEQFQPEHDDLMPKELAQAILQHEFAPQSGSEPAMSFGIRMAEDIELKIAQARTQKLLTSLQTIAQIGSTTIAEKNDFKRNALPVLQAYKNSFSKLRKRSLELTNTLPHQDAYAMPYSHIVDEAQHLEDYSVVLNNLKKLETLMRNLADKFHVSLAEPGRDR